jgi:hypothetical protein
MAQASLRCIDFTYKKVVDREDAKIDDEGLTLLGSVGLKDQAGRPVGAPAAASSPPQTGSGARIARLGRNGGANICGSRELFFAFSNFWGCYTGFVGAFFFFAVFPKIGFWDSISTLLELLYELTKWLYEAAIFCMCWHSLLQNNVKNPSVKLAVMPSAFGLQSFPSFSFQFGQAQ